MRTEQFIRFIVIGIVLSVVGLFLPWGKEYYLPVLGVGQGFMFGIELLLGTQVIVGCILVAVFSFLSIRTEKKFWLIPVVLGGFFAVYSTLMWIQSPSTEAWHWGWIQGVGFTLVRQGSTYVQYEIGFGAYISLIGSVVASISAIVRLVSEVFFEETSL